MGGAVGAMQIAGAVMNAAGSYFQGASEKATANANAQIYEAQARNIAESKKITDSQYRTKKNVLRGQAVTNAARSGLKISGTTASSISQSIMQLQMDNAYEQYNLDVKRQNALNNATLQRMQGKQAYMSGIFNAGQSLLSSASSYYDKYWQGAGSVTSSGGNNVFTWFKGQANKIKSWGNTRLSGGLPTTNRQIYYTSGNPLT